MKKPGLLSKYFNKQTAWPAAMTTLEAGLSVYNFSGGSTLGVIFGGLMTAAAVGSLNQWQHAATGKHFWKPRTPFGL